MQKTILLLWTTILVISVSFSNLSGQDERKNIGNLVAFHFQFGGSTPVGDLSDRFGTTLSIGTGIDYITEKNNLIFGLKGDYQFGNTVKENVLGGIVADGYLFGVNQSDALDFQFKQRGFYFGGHIGKIFAISETNKRSGIRVTLGAGLFQHKIRLQQDATNYVPQLGGEYAKGYDRLTNGLALRQFVGYQLLGKDKLTNLMIGLEFIQGFTKNRRSYDFSEMRQNTDSRFDGLIGLKIGWTLPIYVGKSTGEIYY